MAQENPISRRTAMKLTGAAAATALVAGCGDDDNGDDNGDDGNDNSAEAWEDVSEFELLGASGGWEGVAPDAIDGVQNPTLYLTEGEDYEVTWVNDDGIEHDFVVEDADGETLEQSDSEDTEGESVTMSFEATEDMAEYYCTPHPQNMRGDVDIQ